MVEKQIWKVLYGASLWSQYAFTIYIKGHISNIDKPFPAGVSRGIFREAKQLVLSNTQWIPMDGNSIDILKDN